MGDEHFEFYIGEDDEYRWRLRAPNGEIIASGEGYKEKRDCKAGIELVKKYSPTARVDDYTD